jgi:glycerophosphoryl diester phosphodiesterase
MNGGAHRAAQPQWPYERIVAHRGGGTVAPENTLAGMREAHRRGLRAVEFDVMLARDGIPVVMHDPHLGRTVAGHGHIDSIDSARLHAMDAGAWFDARHAGEPIPLFADMARWLRDNGMWMNIEIKPCPGHEARTGHVVAQLAQSLFADIDDVARRPLLSSFSEEALIAAREAAPDLPRGLLVTRIPHDWHARLQALDAVSLHCRHDHLTEPLAAAIKGQGYGLLCYTVNDPDRARQLFAWGMDSLCTDRIDLIGADFH